MGKIDDELEISILRVQVKDLELEARQTAMHHDRQVEKLRKECDDASWAYHRALASKQELRDVIEDLRRKVNVLESNASTENHHELLRCAREGRDEFERLNAEQAGRISELKAELEKLKTTRTLTHDAISKQSTTIMGLRERLKQIHALTGAA